MSADNEIWLSLAESKYPGLNTEQLLELRAEAACDWWLGSNNDKLSTLFDQYVMIKNLKNPVDSAI